MKERKDFLKPANHTADMGSLLPLLLITVLAAAVPVATALPEKNSNDCTALAGSASGDDVAYQPGVDAYGNAVAPADLSDQGRITDNTNDIVIAINKPLIATAGVVGDQAAFVAAGGRIDVFGAVSSVGFVTLRDGEAYFNGQPITDNRHRAIATAATAACAEEP